MNKHLIWYIWLWTICKQWYLNFKNSKCSIPSPILLRYISTRIILRSQIIAFSLSWWHSEEVLDFFKASKSKRDGNKCRFDILDKKTYNVFCNNSNIICRLYKITQPWWALFKSWQQRKHYFIKPNWLTYLCQRLIRSSSVCLIPPFHISYSYTHHYYCKAIWLNTLSWI